MSRFTYLQEITAEIVLQVFFVDICKWNLFTEHAVNEANTTENLYANLRHLL